MARMPAAALIKSVYADFCSVGFVSSSLDPFPVEAHLSAGLGSAVLLASQAAEDELIDPEDLATYEYSEMG